MSELDKFLEERMKIPIPSGDVAPVKLLAKELALGVDRNLWKTSVTVVRSSGEIYELRSGIQSNIGPFLKARWSDKDVDQQLEQLKGRQFISTTDEGFEIGRAAFDLLNETEPYNIFISYKRSESSMLALLVNNTLKLNGFNPFFDMQLKPTEEWHARLEQRIKESNYLVALLGPETHCSKYTVREIHWAMTHNIPIVQVWQHGYSFEASDWSYVEYPAVPRKLEREQAVVPIADNAEGYHLALESLLNLLGITP